MLYDLRWANDRKMPLALQIDKNTLGEGFPWLLEGTRAMLEANQSVGGNAFGLLSASRVCQTWWKGVR